MKINKPKEVSVDEANQYVKYIQDKYKRKLNVLTIIADGDEVELHFEFEPCSFERIRRITGYLSSVDTWNNGKRAELKDRVKHDGLFE